MRRAAPPAVLPRCDGGDAEGPGRWVRPGGGACRRNGITCFSRSPARAVTRTRRESLRRNGQSRPGPGPGAQPGTETGCLY